MKTGVLVFVWLFLSGLLFTGWLPDANGGEAMSSEDARAEKAARVMKKWLGDAPSPLRETDPDLAGISEKLIYGEIIPSGSLSEKQTALILLAGLAASQSWEVFESQVAAALAVGASGAEIRETLYQCDPYVGLSRIQQALRLSLPAFRAAGISLPLESGATVTEEDRLRKGLDLQRKIFGAENIDKMRENAPQEQKALVANYLSAWCFGDFYTRKTLDLKMRELITFSAIVALGGCDPQAKAHAAANISVGNSKENLVDALAALLPWIGFPRALNGLAAVNAATAQ